MFKLAFAALLVFTLVAEPMSAQEASIETVMEAHIKALGGKEAIEKVQSFHRNSKAGGTAGAYPIDGKMEEVVDLKNRRFWSLMDLGAYTKQSVLSGESNWTEDTQQGKKEMPEQEAGLVKLNIGISPLLSVHSEYPQALTLGKEVKFNDKQCQEVLVHQAPIKFYVGTKSNLVEGIEIESLGSITYEQYKAVEGVMFANRITTLMEPVGMKLVNDYTSTKINAEIDESLFGKEKKAKTETMQDSPEYSAEQIIGFLDKDGDEKISKEEAKASPELSPAFAFVDTSKDGFIDMKEAEAMVAYMKKEKQANQPATDGKKTTAKEIIASMDKNKDGKISKDEASEELKPFFSDYDSNSDGFIDLKEGQAIAKFVSGK